MNILKNKKIIISAMLIMCICMSAVCFAAEGDEETGGTTTSGMSDFIGDLNTGLSATAMWGAISDAAPLIITLVLFALAFYLVRKLIKGAGKGKIRM